MRGEEVQIVHCWKSSHARHHVERHKGGNCSVVGYFYTGDRADAEIEQIADDECNSNSFEGIYFTKPALFLREKTEDSDDRTNASSGRRNKAVVFSQALQEAGVSFEAQVDLRVALGPRPENLYKNWAKYPGNSGYHLSAPCLWELKALYDIGQSHKKKKVSAEQAQEILLNQVIQDEWDMQLHATVPKIKAFFSLTLQKMMQAIDTQTVDEAAVEMAQA